ncbi:MAG: hypothetical protein RL375_182 [Pseudomonadota bacterium]|jgi:phage virion morphogenesis protein
MSGVGITFGFDDGPIRRHLAALALLHASGFDRARREIGEYMVGEVQDNLRSQKLVDGTAMPPSKAAQKRGDAEHSGKTLIAKGHLRDSYTYNLVPGGVEVGSGKVYAAIHHFGGETGRPGHRFTMPARPVLGLNADGEREVGDILLGELRRAQRV